VKRKKIVLGVCASIAAYRACDIINTLKKQNIDVVVCLTKDAKHFITPLTLQTLSGERVFIDMFKPIKEWDPLHISLAKQADLILVAPSSADIISKVASGACNDLLSCTIASTEAPVLFAPAMNNIMYKNKIVQENISKLKKMGYEFVGPEKGHLACGTKAIGHIADTDDIVRQVKSLLKK